ncbi:MAG: sialidase family protein [Planctomycetaceae bacterium]
MPRSISSVYLRMFAVCGILHVLMPMANAEDFAAVDHSRTTIYHSPQSPGYTCWVGAWIMPDGDLMTCFTQATGPIEGRPKAPKDVMELLSWYPEYDMTGLDMHNVQLRSSDAGKSWKQVSADPFKTCMNGVTGEAQTALADGTIVRGVFGFYLPYDDDAPKTGFLQRSTDGTKTWGKPEVLLDPEKFTIWPRRIRTLRDGRVLLLAGVAPLPAGKHNRIEFSKAIQPMILISSDQGRTWTEPISAVAEDQREGWTEEFDIAELEIGDLLTIYRRENDKHRWQAMLKKSGPKFVPEPAGPNVLPHSGQPELIATKEGPILHVATSGVDWTNDAGETWSHFDVPATGYYPRSVQSKDGSIHVFGHVGGDNSYGSTDQSIVMDTFRLQTK